MKDIWEGGTGELLTDRETTLLIASVQEQANQLGEHAFKYYHLLLLVCF